MSGCGRHAHEAPRTYALAFALHEANDMLRRALIVTSLLVSATASANEAPEAQTTSYRGYTLAADAVGLSLLVAGGFAEGDNGRDTAASEALFTGGILTTAFATPLIHLSRGHGGRFVGSFLLRSGLAGLGMVIAMEANSGCDDGQPASEGTLFDDDFLCELDYIGYGFLGGLIVASALDAAFMTDEEVAPTWAPRVWAGRDGGGVGAAWAW